MHSAWTARPNTTPHSALAPSSAPVLHFRQRCGTNSHWPSPLSAAPFQNGSSLPRQPAASVLLGAHAGQLRLVLSAHARRPSPAVWPDIPLHLTCCERLAEPALTSWLRPSPNVSVRKLVRLRRRVARVLGAWSGVHGLFSLFLGGVVFEWRPSRCPPARLRDASRGCADPCGSL